MAKKTIFEGVINGIKFDNVKDYNEYLTKLINAGESFSASTSTKSERETCCSRECETCCETCNECECNESGPVMMLPGYIIGRDNDKSYVDLYVSDNAIMDKQSFEELKDELGDNMEGVIKKIHKMDRAALEGYLKDVNEVLGVINTDYNNTKRHIVERDQEIERLQNESQKLYRATKVLELWQDNYLSIRDTINDAMTIDNTKPSNDADDEVAKELEDRLVGAMSKLMDCFGIDLKDIKNLKIGY